MFESLFYITGIASVVLAFFLYLSIKSADEMQQADAKEINELMAQVRLLKARLEVKDPKPAYPFTGRDRPKAVIPVPPPRQVRHYTDAEFMAALNADHDDPCHTCPHTKGEHYATVPICTKCDCDGFYVGRM